MNVETKFDINSEVWFVHPLSKRAVIGKVTNIRVEISSTPEYKPGTKKDLIRTGNYTKRGLNIFYTIDDNITKNGCGKNQSDVFKTKEELILSIKSNADSL